MFTRAVRQPVMIAAGIALFQLPSPASAQQVDTTFGAACGYVFAFPATTNPPAYETSQRFACPGPGSRDERNAQAIGQNTTAIGIRANAIGDGSTAVGYASRASATSSLALGTAAGVDSGATGSVALGAGSIATQPNTVSVGTPGQERRIVNVAAGTAGSDAATVSQLNSVAVASFDLRRSDRQEMRRGVAAAMAMGSASMPSAPGRTSYVMNVSTYRGEQAVGGSLMYRLPTAKPVAVTAGFSLSGNKSSGAKVGVAGEF